jgi:hypothetical protein
MRQNRESVGIGVGPVCTNNDLSAFSQAVAGDLRGKAIRKADHDVQRLDKVAPSNPENSRTVVGRRSGRPTSFAVFWWLP